MPIKLTDELVSKTKKGKVASAKQVYLEGDKENLQQIGEQTHQLKELVDAITVTGGASVASAVTYDHTTSGITAVTIQGAVDELAAKNKSQDTTIESKANKKDVEQSLGEKLDNKNIQQVLGDNEDMVPSLKLTKDELSKKVDSETYEEKIKSIDDSLSTKAATDDVNTELAKKFDKANIAQELSSDTVDTEESEETVDDTEKVPSLSLVKKSLENVNTNLGNKSDEINKKLEEKFDKESIDVESISEETTKVPSSKLVKGSLSKLESKVDNLPMQKVQHLTQSEYEALSSIDSDTYYMCTEE